MSNATHPHPVPAAGLFGAAWQLSRGPVAAPAADAFEARYVANDRSVAEHAAKGAHRLRLVA